MNVTSYVQLAYHQEISNLGFCVRDDIEYDATRWGTFWSSDSGGSYLPVLSITYSGVTLYQYWDGGWPAGVSDDLNIYIGGTANDLYGDELDNCWQRWNGINAGLNVDGLYRTGTPDNYRIRFLIDASLDNDAYGWTDLLDSNWEPIASFDDTWYYSRIYLNPNSTSNMYVSHDHIQEETIIHEMGHAMGLAHVPAFDGSSSVCIMQQSAFYCYPYPTSHDMNTVNAKY